MEAMRTISGGPDDPKSQPIKAIPRLIISGDGMRAELSLTAPQFGGASLSEKELMDLLSDAGVVYGIDRELIGRLAEHPQYGPSFVAAAGLPAVHGEAAKLTYMVKLGKDLRPRENPDGSVDYKDLGVIQNVRENDVLCVKTPAGEGEPGSTVYGVAILPKPGRDTALPMGKNTKLSEDQLQLLAAGDGQVDMVGKKLTVLSTYTVRGDVSNATGNIDFLGNLIIYGNILTGFSVRAGGNITVNGSVEDALVIAGGNIVLTEGIHGGGAGSQNGVVAGGTIKSKYIQNGNVRAGGDIESTFVQHSFVQSGNNVNVIGSKGRLAGGRIIARNNINTVYAGGANSAIPTVLEVGNNPATVEAHWQLEQQIEALSGQMQSLEPAITMLEELEQAGDIPEDKLEALNQARGVYGSLKETMLGLREEMEWIKAELDTMGYGSVNIRQSAYSGVRIVIGPEQLLLETQYDATSFVRGSQGIAFGPYRV